MPQYQSSSLKSQLSIKFSQWTFRNSESLTSHNVHPHKLIDRDAHCHPISMCLRAPTQSLLHGCESAVMQILCERITSCLQHSPKLEKKLPNEQN